jgi:hypothetical protein
MVRVQANTGSAPCGCWAEGVLQAPCLITASNLQGRGVGSASVCEAAREHTSEMEVTASLILSQRRCLIASVAPLL